jgi:hypothetical protein
MGMTYQLTITIETILPSADVAKEVQAALGAWGIDSSNPVVSSALETATAAEIAKCREFTQKITKLVDDYVNR